MTFACFSGGGTYPSDHIFYISYAVIFVAVAPPPFISSAEMPSGPAAAFILSFLIAKATCSSVGGFHISATG